MAANCRIKTVKTQDKMTIRYAIEALFKRHLNKWIVSRRVLAYLLSIGCEVDLYDTEDILDSIYEDSVCNPYITFRKFDGKYRCVSYFGESELLIH